jgi:predicted glycosyltransferase
MTSQVSKVAHWMWGARHEADAGDEEGGRPGRSSPSLRVAGRAAAARARTVRPSYAAAAYEGPPGGSAATSAAARGTRAPARRSSLHRRRRFLFYCNEMVGLGHLRRTLAIAECLAHAHDDVTSLVITGCPVEWIFSLPPRTDTVKLPVRTRSSQGHARSRLTLEADELRALRAELALAVATAFDPDVVVVDKLPLGVDGELEPTLRALRARGGRCKLVLGLRDIDDSPANVRRKWGFGMRDAIRRYYDTILVYGPSSTPDAIACMGWKRLDVPVLHVGYVGAPMPATGPDDLPDGYLLATSGAGHDGFELLATLGEAIRAEPLPCETVMVAGPLRDPDKLEQLRRLTAGLAVQLYPYRADLPRLIVGARGVVSMAGYNTVGEIMRTRKPALLVPRVRPSEEQLIRAQRLARRGLQQMLHPADVRPARLRAELDTLLARPAPPIELDDYTGAERTVDVLAGMAGLGQTTPAAFPAARRPASTREMGATLVHAAALRVLRRTAALHERRGERA